MGVGRPEDILEAVDRGCDLFDCVLPTRNARKGSVFTSRGKLVVKNATYAEDERPLDPDCPCPVCRTFSRAYLRHLFAAGEILAMRLATLHSLQYYQDLMEGIRSALAEGRFAAFKREPLERLAGRPGLTPGPAGREGKGKRSDVRPLLARGGPGARPRPARPAARSSASSRSFCSSSRSCSSCTS